jgi:streptomycin 6-kinase
VSPTSGFTYPQQLLDEVERRADAEMREWLAALPALVGELAARWSLALDEPFQPGGVASWVAPATDSSGREVVLKVGWPHFESIHERDGLQAWDGNGTVRLYASDTLDDTIALLIERCVPGTTLASVPEAEQDLVIAQLLRNLWCEPDAEHPFRTLQYMCDSWADSFERKIATRDLAIDPGLARAGIELFRSLPSTADRNVLLVTDLHAGNVLRAEREPWLVIDPKPFVGDPTYDALQHILNCEARLHADPLGLVARMAQLVEVDDERLRLWLFARCVEESADWPGLLDVAIAVAP